MTVSQGPSAGPLRILIGCDTFAPDLNGSASFAKRLAARLIERGHDVQIAAPAQDRHHGIKREVHDGVEMIVHRIYSWPWWPHPWVRFVLPWRSNHHGRRLVKLVKPDVIHFQSHIVVGRGLAKAGKKRGIRVIGTNHTMPENIAARDRAAAVRGALAGRLPVAFRAQRVRDGG